MKLFAVRHGETNYNVKRIMNITPSNECHLTEKGFKQAEEVKKKLEGETFDAVIVSEFYRTQQTAAVILGDTVTPMIIDSRINEINSGIEGESYDKYHKRLGELDLIKKRYIIPEGGESFDMVRARVKEFLDELKKKSFKNVLVVSHYVTLIVLKELIEGLSDEESIKVDPENGEVYSYILG